MAQTQFPLIKTNNDWKSRTLANPPPHPPPTSKKISFLPYTPTHPQHRAAPHHHYGRHMCITPKVISKVNVKLKFLHRKDNI